jgi:hypothetical protein
MTISYVSVPMVYYRIDHNQFSEYIKKMKAFIEQPLTFPQRFMHSSFRIQQENEGICRAVPHLPSKIHGQ